MNIQLDKDYRTSNTSLNLVLNKRVEEYTNKKGEVIPEKYIVDGYYSDIKHLLKSYLKKAIRTTDATTINDLIDKVEEVEKNIRDLDIEYQIDRFIEFNNTLEKIKKESVSNE